MFLSKSLGQCLGAARKYVLGVGVCLIACVTPLCAQQSQQLTRPKVEGKIIFGSADFIAVDDTDLQHTLVGAAVRVYVTKRLSIEPEYVYLRRNDNDQDQILQPNVAFDFTDPTKRVVAYGIAGAGVLYHKSRYFGSDASFTTWTASAGGGIKIFLTKRFFVSPEIRVGHEPLLRATVNAGYVFGGRR